MKRVIHGISKPLPKISGLERDSSGHPDEEQLLCGARAIGRTIDVKDHIRRAREVWRAMMERDMGEDPR